ncbi:hypothetical protein KsCSTR_48570 [Candidatus Kuenenia stuttgartiensis]|uniref:Uncharacterized protein n=1 Tax=Kuenenia stuttgartiensis TaxID=174633 RepID=Q1PVM3_KUEST|nr:hypothetical protein KsCSTR_48570 [Candidatus Kuenenia stuttgartiensis]CAJ71272.1 unknown protein [Candidatus Kuenenia stuttgartiensis]
MFKKNCGTDESKWYLYKKDNICYHRFQGIFSNYGNYLANRGKSSNIRHCPIKANVFLIFFVQFIFINN